MTGKIRLITLCLCLVMFGYVRTPAGAEPIYIVTFELYQVNYSLSISTYARNQMNKVEFEVPVSREYFNQVYAGQEILDSFRMGSAVVRGSFGKWKIKIKNKRQL